MLPRDLKAEQFASYPPEARKLVTQNLPALQRLPLVFLPSLLREVIEYDFKFPAERKAIDREVANFAHLSPDQISDWFGAFSRIELSSKLERFDWVNSPAQFVEQLSAHLWRTHQLDAFRLAATAYAGRLHAAAPPEPPPIPRLGISIIGQGVEAYSAPVFRYLRPHGVYFKHVNPQDGLSILLDAVASRAKARPISYGYIDGKKGVEKKMSGRGVDSKFTVTADDSTLAGDGADTTRVVMRVTDEFDAIRPFANDSIKLDLEGAAEIIGDNPFSLVGGGGAVWIRAKQQAGTVRLTATHPTLGVRRLEIQITDAPPEEA